MRQLCTVSVLDCLSPYALYIVVYNITTITHSEGVNALSVIHHIPGLARDVVWVCVCLCVFDRYICA